MNVAVKPRLQFPNKAKVLFRPAPYKVMDGGRGAAKSWSFVRAALILGSNRPLFILCTREVQQSIDESVYKLICDQIVEMGLGGFYTPFDQEVRAINGTRIVFAGLKNQFNKIKSYEGIDLCMVFEATHISDPAWEALIPTIRGDPPKGPFGEGSEIWVEFNPDLASDATYKRFVLNPPEGAIVVDMNYWDNPWFPQLLRKQMEEMKAKDHDRYLNIWCGQPSRVLQGAVYAKELAAALLDTPPRISPHVKYDKTKPVTVAFDLGRADTCSLWFFQQFGMDHAAIDYYGNVGYDFSHYLDEMEGRRYRYNEIVLPHDAKHKVISAKFSVLQQARDAYGPDRVPKPLPPTPSAIRINAARSIFPRMFFAEGPTSEGVQGLQHYQFGVDNNGKRTADPLHNWASHPANAFEHYALSRRRDLREREDYELIEDIVEPVPSAARSTSWMA